MGAVFDVAVNEGCERVCIKIKPFIFIGFLYCCRSWRLMMRMPRSRSWGTEDPFTPSQMWRTSAGCPLSKLFVNWATPPSQPETSLLLTECLLLSAWKHVSSLKNKSVHLKLKNSVFFCVRLLSDVNGVHVSTARQCEFVSCKKQKDSQTLSVMKLN